MNTIEFDFKQKGILGEWVNHPKFQGVSLAEIGYNKMDSWRALLVSVDGGKEMSAHSHENETEFHFVITGTAKTRIGDEVVEYTPGFISRIPCGMEHEIKSGSDGIVMVAIFSKE